VQKLKLAAVGDRRLQHQRFNLSGGFPFLRCRNRSRASRIIENVIPFLAVTLIGAKNLIKELALTQLRSILDRGFSYPDLFCHSSF
jgi:hypothetical protein